MKKLPIRIMSAAMVASLMLSFSACSKSGGGSMGFGGGSGSGTVTADQRRSGAKITADSPWFDAKKLDIDNTLNVSKPVEYTYKSLGGIDKDRMIIITNGSYKMDGISDDDIMSGVVNYDDFQFTYIDVIDRSTGKSVNTIDATKILDSGDYLEGAELVDGKMICHVVSFDMNTYESISKIVEVDPDSGEVLSKSKGDNSGNNVERSFNIGDYVVQTELDWSGDEGSYKVYLNSPDGSTSKFDIKKSGTDIYDIPVVLPINETTALVPASTNDGWMYFELDMKNAKINEVDGKNYEWLDLNNVYSAYFSEDGGIYYASSTGIFKINMKDKVTEKFFDFSWCGVNRNDLAYLQIAEITDDKFILCGDNYNYNPYESTESSSNFMVYEFTRAATNPNAGKTVLELYQSWGYTDDKVADVILKFNQTNSEYYIEVTDRYKEDSDSVNWDNMNSDDDYQRSQMDLDSKLSNELAMDILNGEGPDILMNVSRYGQLNNSNYLADLTPYVGTLDPNKYFTNIIDASKVDGKLYNLPVCYVINGIQTDKKYVGASGVGFTTEEYVKFVDEVLNGKDIIVNGQSLYFAKLFNAMSDKFIVDGKVDFSSPEFAKLAEYVKDHVSPNAQTWDEMYPQAEIAYGVGATVKADSYVAGSDDAIYGDCYGMSGYLTTMAQVKGGDVICGIPSADGRGPVFDPYVSVAVSAQSVNKDACGEFVKMLLSDEIQLDLAMKDNFVLSREAFRQGAEKAVEYYNGDGYEYYFGHDDDQMKNRIHYSEANIDTMENIILSCSKMSSADAEITLILVEEMPAYFTGQKDLDSVITIAQERAQKVLNERG